MMLSIDMQDPRPHVELTGANTQMQEAVAVVLPNMTSVGRRRYIEVAENGGEDAGVHKPRRMTVARKGPSLVEFEPVPCSQQTVK